MVVALAFPPFDAAITLMSLTVLPLMLVMEITLDTLAPPLTFRRISF
jgi:hypothetical protein